MLDRLDLAALAAEMTAGFGIGPHALTGPETVMLALADAGPDSCIILFAPGALRLVHALLAQGRRNVTIVQTTAIRPSVALADLVLVPEVGSPVFMASAASYARRALKPLGTMIVKLSADSPVDAARHAIRQLSLNGLTMIRSRTVFGETLLSAQAQERRTLRCA